MIGLNTVFKQVFGEGLKEQGFVKVKGRHPYVVRVVEGGEIIHVFSCRNSWLGERGYKAFEILGQVITVYNATTVDLTKTPTQNIGWLQLEPMLGFYVKSDPVNSDREYRNYLSQFIYRQDDEEALCSAMQEALGAAKKIVLPIFDGVTNLELCIKYFKRYGNSAANAPHLYIKTDNHDDFIKENEARLAEKIEARIKENQFGAIERIRRDMEAWRLDMIARRDAIYNSPEKYAEVMEVLERRKEKNTEALRALGIKI